MLTKLLAKWMAETDGTTSIEYGMIGGIIGLAFVSGAFVFGSEFNEVLNGVRAYIGAEIS